MNPERIEKIFWLIIILWFILRFILIGCQYYGNTNPSYHQETLKYFSQNDINESREYSLNGIWFKAIFGSIYLFILVLMLRLGLFTNLWVKVTKLAGNGLLKNNLLFTLVFLIILQILSFPFSYYFSYHRESISGFSNINLYGWLLQYFKSATINIIIQSSFILVILAIIKNFPNKWHIIAPLIAGIIAGIFIIVFHVVITPIFYNQKPLESGELRNKLMKIAKDAELSVNEIYVIDESRYSKHTNAYFTGFGNYRRIVLYDNLIKNLTPDEAALIFAHEVGHWKQNHEFWGLLCGIVGAYIVCFIIYNLFEYLTVVKWFGLIDLKTASVLPFFMISYMVLQLFVAPIESQISQFMETQADKISLELTGLNKVFQDAQIRLAKDNKSDLLPHPFRVFWLYSHPTALNRIKLAEIKKQTH